MHLADLGRRPVRLLRIVASAAAGVILMTTSSAQCLERWATTVDHSQIGAGDICTDLVVDRASGQTYVSGYYQPTPINFSGTAFVTSFDDRGNNLWFHTPTGASASSSVLVKLFVHPASGVIAVGTADSPAGGHFTLYVTRIDASGATVWQTTPLPSVQCYAIDLVVDSSGNSFILAGFPSPIPGGYQSALVRLDSLGNLLSSQTLTSPPENSGNGGIRFAPNGELIISILTRVIRMAPNGNILWSTLVEQSPGGVMSVGPDGSAYVATVTPGDPSGGPYQVTRLDPFGVVQWTSTISDPGHRLGAVRSLDVGSSGLVISAGVLVNQAIGSYEGVVVTLDTGGNVVWQYSMNPASVPTYTAVWHVIDAGNGEVAFQGSEPVGSLSHMIVGRLDATGTALWAKTGAVTHSYPWYVAAGLDIDTPGSVITLSTCDGLPPSQANIQIRRFESTQPTYCYGDGASVPCPCGNVGASGHGCPSSVSNSGGVLTGLGVPSVSADSLMLWETSVPNGPGLFFQASTSGESVFGDGKLCASSGFIRLGVAFASASEALFPGSPLSPPIHVSGAASVGNVRYYQTWYRDADTGFCTPSLFNLTNGLVVTWRP